MQRSGILRSKELPGMTRKELQAALTECGPCVESQQGTIIRAELAKRDSLRGTRLKLAAIITTVALALIGWVLLSLSEHRAAGERLFRLEVECSKQARTFEKDWSSKYSKSYGHSSFRNHYNAGLGKCFVDITSINDAGWHETVMDTTEGIDAQPVDFRSIRNLEPGEDPKDAWIDSESGPGETIAKIHSLMGTRIPPRSESSQTH